MNTLFVAVSLLDLAATLALGQRLGTQAEANPLASIAWSVSPFVLVAYKVLLVVAVLMLLGRARRERPKLVYAVKAGACVLTGTVAAGSGVGLWWMQG